MHARIPGSCSGGFLRATLRHNSEANVKVPASSIPSLHSRRMISTASSSFSTTTTSRRRVIGSSFAGASAEACAIGTGRTQSSLPHQVTSRLPTKTARAFTSSTKSLLHSSQQLYFPSNTNSGNMSTFKKETLSPGDGTNYPKQGDTVVMEYTGWLEDKSAANQRGKQFDSSVGRGDFETPIGVGRVIQGWDQGVPQMSKGERAVLTIPGNMAYGARGFPGLIPPNATLIFEVQLKNIKSR